MVLIIEEFLIICIATTFSLSSSSKVVLIPNYSSSAVTIRCKAEDPNASSFMIHLSCPLVNSGFCFSNCTPRCTTNERNDCVSNVNLNAISQCRYEIINEKTIFTSYTINTSRVSVTGDWSCSFKNYKSNSVALAKYELPKTTTATYRDILPVLIEHVTSGKDTIFSTESTEKDNSVVVKDIKPPKITKVTNEYNILHYVTRPELVLILILLLGISLLLNLSFLIRCVLLKSVMENYYQGIPNNECMIECLCLDLVSNKHSQRRYSHNLNVSNEVGHEFYRCQPLYPDNMAIYDDLSAVSNTSARMKLRSNNSSEIDDESHMTSLLPNGHCHVNQLSVGSLSGSLTRRFINPSHATYLHPGFGNYVLVSGPVANHDQYSTATIPSGYTIQMVSPIPSDTGSIERGPVTSNFASSIHSDESDNESRTPQSSSTGIGLQHRSVRVNSQPINVRDSRKFDQTYNMAMPVNGLNRPLLYQHENNFNLYRSNGSVPLHSCSNERVMTTTSSFPSSLPFYTLSENNEFNKELKGSSIKEQAPPNESNQF